MEKRAMFPRTIAGFTEYIKIAYQKASTNLSTYGISQAKFGVLTPYYNDYIAKEATAADPDTATKGSRAARDVAREALEKEWRHFLNENIRYNTAVSVEDLEVFGIEPHDNVRTPPLTPTDTGILDVRRLGAYRYEIYVIDEKTGKRKLPPHATGSYLYLAVSEIGKQPEEVESYRKLDFSSNTRHNVDFTSADLSKQANLYARYSNQHGKEGPIGPIATFIIN
ncbi:MAG: hypothetical protein LBP98_02050 [Tannerella sp.]|jgi:hypothetical protein|nr:hypothetical protein [Tannerella sp.]